MPLSQRDLARRVLEHYGPGAHDNGSPQAAHGGANAMTARYAAAWTAGRGYLGDEGAGSTVDRSVKFGRPTTGYGVGRAGVDGDELELGKGWRTPKGQLQLRKAIKAFLDRNDSAYDRDKTLKLGTWISPLTGHLWIDASQQIMSRKKAGALGHVRKEEGIFDFGKTRTIMLRHKRVKESEAEKDDGKRVWFSGTRAEILEKACAYWARMAKRGSLKEALVARRALARMEAAAGVKDARFRRLARRILEHYGPGAHPSGSGQDVHGGGYGFVQKRIGQADADRAFPGPRQANADTTAPSTNAGVIGHEGLLDSGGTSAHAGGAFVNGKWTWNTPKDKVEAKAIESAKKQLAAMGIDMDEAASRLASQTRWALDHPAEVEKATAGSKEGALTPAMQEAAKGWYSDVHRELRGMAKETGLPLDTMAGIAAVLSPQHGWDEELPVIRGIVDRWKANDPVVVTKEQLDIRMEKLFTGKGKPIPANEQALYGYVGKEMHFRDQIPGVLRYLAGTMPGMGSGAGVQSLIKASDLLSGASVDKTVGGRKVRSFYNNMRYPNNQNIFTVDIHEVRILYNDFSIPSVPKSLKELKPGETRDLRYTSVMTNDAQYALFHSLGNEAARRLGMRPNAFQAYQWVVARAAVGKGRGGKNLGKGARKGRGGDITWEQNVMMREALREAIRRFRR